MIWTSRSERTRSAISSAFSVSGSSGSRSAIGGMTEMRPYSSALRDARIAPDSLCRRSTGRDWRDDFLRLMHAPPIEAFEQRRQLRRRQSDHAVFDLRPAELAVLEPFGEQTHASPVPEDQLDPVSPFGAEHIDGAGKWIGFHLLAH